ncbi:DUF58 domain-containing protein [Mariniluteicoccus endophyticus]
MALLTKVKTRMAIHAHRKVRGLLDGEYASMHSGRSMDFHDLREYVVGDDVKDIDWRATARHGEVLIRRYVADRKHTILLVVSTGRSMAGLCDPQTTKREVAILVSGIIGWLAIRHGDHVGLITGDASGHHQVRPGDTEVALERMLARIQDATRPDGPVADLDGLLAYAVRSVRRRTIMLVVTDDVELSEDDERQLRRLRAQHEVLLVTLGDLDPTDPALGDQSVVDLDSRAAVPDFVRGDRALHEELVAQAAERMARRRKQLDRLGIAHEHVTDSAQVVQAVFRLLERHRHASR